MPKTTLLRKQVTPVGSIQSHAGTSAPEGYLICDGSIITIASYPNLYAAIGTSWGYGNNDGLTFHLPDLRGKFLRGKVNINTISGSGTASSNNATFTSHGVNRTGFKLRLSSGTLTGLGANTDYYAIVVDSNTLAFATSKANALAGTKIAISGTNSAVITQYEDPDASSRTVNGVGGNTGNNIGSVQDDQLGTHGHFVAHDGGAANYSYGTNIVDGSGATSAARNSRSNTSNTGGSESRPQNSLVNFIIKAV